MLIPVMSTLEKHGGGPPSAVGGTPDLPGAHVPCRLSAVTGRLSNERRPTEPPRPRYRGSPSRSGRSYLPAPPSPASTNGAQTVDGRTRVGFSDRASPSQLGAVPRPGRLSGRSSVRQGAEFDGRDRGDPTNATRGSTGH